MTTVQVVAAVVARGPRLLVALRPKNKRHGGLWEFPGGKVDEGEDAKEAASRELAEELALEVVHVGDRLIAFQDDASPFLIDFRPVSVSGEPRPLEHDEVGWFTLDELHAMPLAPADARFVRWYGSKQAAGAAREPESDA